MPGDDAGPQFPLDIPEHADLRWISPPEDKHSIGIEQIRQLVEALSLTSYEGRGKVAVIEPANAMTDSAANSLLKTLEEPAGNALLILVVDRKGRLPATIFSRCQRMNIALPDAERSLNWLRRYDGSADWEAVLRLAGGAPLSAVHARGQLEPSRGMSQEFAALAQGGESAISVAGRWAKLEPAFVLDWLAHQVQSYARLAMGCDPGVAGSEIQDSVLRRIDRRNLFCYLDIINGLRGQAPGSFNVALTLESLLIEWSGGLKTCRDRFGPGELLPGTATR